MRVECNPIEGQAIEEGTAVNGRDACMAILPPPPAPTPIGRHTVRLGNGAGAARKYAVAALEFEACYVETARPGERNNTLNRAAFCVATLIPGGAISESEVEEILTAAALKAGLSFGECGLNASSITQIGLFHRL